MIRQGAARRLALVARKLAFKDRGRRDEFGLRFDLGLRLLKIGDGELELLDELLAAFGCLAELDAARLGELQLQPFDLELEAGPLVLGEIDARLRLGQQIALRQDQRMRGSASARGIFCQTWKTSCAPAASPSIGGAPEARPAQGLTMKMMRRYVSKAIKPRCNWRCMNVRHNWRSGRRKFDGTSLGAFPPSLSSEPHG